MKKPFLLILSLGLFLPVIHAEPVKPAIPAVKTAAASDPAAVADAKKQAESLSPEQSAKLLELLNKGDAKSIEAIKGIGPKRSQAIIAKRPYKTVDELAKVDDLGTKTFGDVITFAKGQQVEAVKKPAAKKTESTEKMK